ncbi:CcdB family protein [Paraburkholderia sp. A3RO-2L]|uniref:CcdB family protein n=1 Tax=unclassified Paraburkholderia TaxID=2615204 RepID=UPI003DA993E4
MARLDLFHNPHGEGYLIDVQSDQLLRARTRMVIPLLLKSKAPKPIPVLNPEFILEGQPYILTTQFMAAIPTRELVDPIRNLGMSGETIRAALDMLLEHGAHAWQPG